jgi:hypothetical protein
VPLPPSSVRGMVWGLLPVFVEVRGRRWPSQEPTPEADPVVPRVRQGGPAPKGSGETEPVPPGLDKAELSPGGRARLGPCPWGRASRSPHSWGRSGRSSTLKGRPGHDHVPDLPTSWLLALSSGMGIIDTRHNVLENQEKSHFFE